MVKRITILLLSAMCAAFLPSCSESGMTKLGDVKTVEINGFVMKTEFDTYSPKDTIKVILENHGERTINYGEYYTIEYYKDGDWYSLDRKEKHSAVPAIQYNLPTDYTDDFYINRENYKCGKWPKGRLRVVNSFRLKDAGEGGGLVACEFEVV